jgi:tyrosine-specific transport protein
LYWENRSMISTLFKNQRLIGAILLVAGTTIGAGMLALPVITAFMGFYLSLFIFVLFWLVMLVSAFFFLDVTLSMPGEPNMVSMASKTLGTFGKALCWSAYLLLLYSLLAAYIAGSIPILIIGFKSAFGAVLNKAFAAFILPFLFSGFLWFGTQGVDYLNRLLISGLAIAYLCLIVWAPSHIDFSNFLVFSPKHIFVAIPIVLTSLGYHIIIPTLSTYLEHNRKNLKTALIIGSLIPIIFYIIWQFLIIGSIPLPFLKEAWIKGASSAEPLMTLGASPYIRLATTFFAFFAIITSFLGVSLSLSDFLRDGFKLKKSWEGRLLAYFLTFFPPIVFVFSYKRVFYLALDHAGTLIAILLIMMPSLMAAKLKNNRFYQSFYGKILLYSMVVISLCAVVVDILLRKGYFNPLIP